ncbi:MAG: hypothetical protein GC178_09130 [Flavobacteriales bacterium]|nr:hypothetical protein [Flavobacteriales bacterium]
MKELLTIIFTLFAVTSKAQFTHEEFKGHWCFCDPLEEYSEVVITDSLIDLLNVDLFGMIPMHYHFDNGFALSNWAFESDDSRWSLSENQDIDTLNFEVLSPDQMIIFWYGRNDTLTRLKEKPKNFYDYDCSVGMSWQKFEALLLYEFNQRRIRGNLYCPPRILSEIDSKDNNIYEVDIDWEKDSISPHISAPFVEYQYIDIDSIKLSKPKFVLEKWNPDSSICLIVFDYFGPCYDEYMHHAKIDSSGALGLILKPQRFSKCPDRCAIRFYFDLSVTNFRFDTILLNGTRIK